MDDYQVDRNSSLIACMQRALQDGASKLWHWCKSFVCRASPQYRIKEMDDVMLDLLEAEEALTGSLVNAEKAMELAPALTRPTSSLMALDYLQVIKTRVQQGLEEVNRRRTVAFKRLPLSDVINTVV